MLIIPVNVRLRQGDKELKNIFGQVTNWRPNWAI